MKIRHVSSLFPSIVVILVAMVIPVTLPGQEVTEKAEVPKEEVGPVTESLPPPVSKPADNEVEATLLTDREARVVNFVIPAPRGLITDRDGRPLAATRAATRCAIRLASIGSEDSSFEDQKAPIQEWLKRLRAALPEIELPDERSLRVHWENRRVIPMVFGDVLTDEQEAAFAKFEKGAVFVPETVYVRDYPAGRDAAHLVGYVGSERPDQHGPLADQEPRWPEVHGKAGLEASLNESLAGTDGIVSEIFDHAGNQTERQVIEAAMPGRTIVTSISLPMQQLAGKVLRESGRPGAFVVTDAKTGDILVMASNPSFDPTELSRGVSVERYREIAHSPDNPLFDRPVSGVYPPGSIFKPMVALAALDRGVVNGLATRFNGPSQIEIDGRTFRNWSDEDEGPLDVRFALMRSCNTWFYQAGIYTGGETIRSAAQAFGFGDAPELPLAAVQKGALPSPRTLAVRQAVANFSIGQGDLLVSPVQVAMAMSGLANGRYVPAARLVLQEQDPFGQGVIDYNAPHERSMINFRSYDLGLVRAGMWGVVNHERGTGRAASLDFPAVYGKTGTAQWTVGGTERALAWFAGYMPVKNGVIAFTVMTEGGEGETLFGGKNAAPMAGEFLKELKANPDKYGVEMPEKRVSPQFASQPVPQSQTPAGVTRANPVYSQTQPGQVQQRPPVPTQPQRRYPTGQYASREAATPERYQSIDPRSARRQLPRPQEERQWEELERGYQDDPRYSTTPREWPYRETQRPAREDSGESRGLVGRILDILN